MRDELFLENWSQLKSLRENKGLSLDVLSEKMRLPLERIEFLEKGIFDKDDIIIIRLQLKNYARILDIDYEELIELAGLKKPTEETQTQTLGTSVNIKKTRTYKGRKKEPNKVLIYFLIILGTLALIFALNRAAVSMGINSDVFEMTKQQKNALDTPSETSIDSSSFKPILPQAQKKIEELDIIEEMDKLHSKTISFPIIIKVFPKDNISYRQEIKGLKTTENYILKDIPLQLEVRHPGRTIFYNAHSTRFVADGLELLDEKFSVILIEINEKREMTIYTK